MHECRMKMSSVERPDPLFACFDSAFITLHSTHGHHRHDRPPRRRPATPLSLLDPRALAKISKMELVARQVMDGYVQGMHRSPHVGFALDFAQHRPYVPGDDIKRIDWRVYAKADRYYIKQYEVTHQPPLPHRPRRQRVDGLPRARRDAAEQVPLRPVRRGVPVATSCCTSRTRPGW